MTKEEAIEIITNALETFAREHDHPCDGIQTCGECFLCEELRQAPGAFKVLGLKWPFKKMPKKGA